MFNRIFAVIAILFAPLLALAVGYKIESVYEAKWRQASDVSLLAASGNLATGSLAKLCADTPTENSLLVCSWYRHLPYMKTGGMLALLLGIMLLGSIYVMARGVQRDRQH